MKSNASIATYAKGAFACLMLALPLAACGRGDTNMPTASIPEDYHARHPVVLKNTRETLDIFVIGNTGTLDQRQIKDVRVFAEAYRTQGQGQIVAMLPSGNGLERASASTLDAIRHVFANNHVTGSISVGTYPVSDPTMAAPIQLSFPKLEAHVHNCGEWPDDLGSGSSLENFKNRSYYNLGCASQKTISAQIDDPRDLVRPRSEDPSDVSMRTRAIGNVRSGTDPGTGWSTHNTSIGSVGN